MSLKSVKELSYLNVKEIVRDWKKKLVEDESFLNRVPSREEMASLIRKQVLEENFCIMDLDIKWVDKNVLNLTAMADGQKIEKKKELDEVEKTIRKVKQVIELAWAVETTFQNPDDSFIEKICPVQEFCVLMQVYPEFQKEETKQILQNQLEPYSLKLYQALQSEMQMKLQDTKNKQIFYEKEKPFLRSLARNGLCEELKMALESRSFRKIPIEKKLEILDGILNTAIQEGKSEVSRLILETPYIQKTKAKENLQSLLWKNFYTALFNSDLEVLKRIISHEQFKEKSEGYEKKLFISVFSYGNEKVTEFFQQQDFFKVDLEEKEKWLFESFEKVISCNIFGDESKQERINIFLKNEDFLRVLEKDPSLAGKTLCRLTCDGQIEAIEKLFSQGIFSKVEFGGENSWEQALHESIQAKNENIMHFIMGHEEIFSKIPLEGSYSLAKILDQHKIAIDPDERPSKRLKIKDKEENVIFSSDASALAPEERHSKRLKIKK